MHRVRAWPIRWKVPPIGGWEEGSVVGGYLVMDGMDAERRSVGGRNRRLAQSLVVGKIRGLCQLDGGLSAQYVAYIFRNLRLESYFPVATDQRSAGTFADFSWSSFASLAPIYSLLNPPTTPPSSFSSSSSSHLPDTSRRFLASHQHWHQSAWSRPRHVLQIGTRNDVAFSQRLIRASSAYSTPLRRPQSFLPFHFLTSDTTHWRIV